VYQILLQNKQKQVGQKIGSNDDYLTVFHNETETQKSWNICYINRIIWFSIDGI